MAAATASVSDIGCGVGLALAKTVRGHEVRSLVKYGPAELSKQILVGDMLFNINDKPTATMSADNVASVRSCISPRARAAISHSCSRSYWAPPIPL